MSDIQTSKRNISSFFLKSDPKTRFRFLPALFISYATPILLALVFSILGAATNPPLAQIYLLLMAISFCLMGILTRSKLMGLLNIFVAPLAFLTIYFISLSTNGFIYNAFGVFSSMTIENQLIILANNLNSLGQQQIAQVILQNSSTVNVVLIIVDLVFVLFIAFFLGLALATLATGLRSKDGSISTMALISKPLAGIFAIMLLLLLPFTYHGTANLIVGAIDMTNGATELAAIFNSQGSGNTAATTADAFAAQVGTGQLNFTDPQVQEFLREKVNAAKEWFMKASERFDHVQANLLLNLILQTVVPSEITLQTGDVIKARNVPQLLDLTDILVDILDAFPYLVTGYSELITGADIVQKTLNETGFGSSVLLESSSITATSIQQLIQYNPEFRTGLQKIQNGVNEFKQAEEPLIRAINKALPLINNVFVSSDGTTQQFLTQILQELKFGLPIALNASDALIPAVNGTYKALLAQKALGLNAFKESLAWLSLASDDINASDTLLETIDTSPLENFNNSLVPFKDAFNFLKDLISTYANFIEAMEGSVETFLSMNATLVALEALDFNETNPSSPQWDQLRQNLTNTRQAIDKAEAAFLVGSAETSTFLSKAQNNQYGPFSTNAEQIFSSVNEFYNTFSSNITDYKLLVFVFELTFNATYEFSAGHYNLKIAIEDAINNSLSGPQFGSLTTSKFAKFNFSLAKTDSETAYNILNLNISGINGQTREKWKDILYEGVNNVQNQSIYWASDAGIGYIDQMNSTGNFNVTYAQQVLAYLEAINFGSIFQQQGGSLANKNMIAATNAGMSLASASSSALQKRD